MKKKVLVGMSGGVDSSVTAYLLKEQGYDVIGVTMCLGIASADDDKTKCCGADAIADAKKVCLALNIPHYVLDFSKEMQKFVIDDFVSEYKKGRTPNPCVQCNKYLKFEKLFNYAQVMNCDFLATGHYARIEQEDNEFFLKKPKDSKKDQTYFLYCIEKEKLANILFPLADYTKKEVREIAEKAGLLVAKKPQSQDICFITDKNYKKFLKQRLGKIKTGDVVDKEGNVLGKHTGIFNYTIGQRRGIGIAHTEPFYVIKLDVANNKVVVGNKKDLESNMLIADKVNLFVDKLPNKCSAKIRYLKQETPCSCEFIDKTKYKVVFDKPQEAITQGQYVVFYAEDKVLGGGVIEIQ